MFSHTDLQRRTDHRTSAESIPQLNTVFIAGELQMPLSTAMFRYSGYIKGRFFLFLKSDYQVK